MTKYSTPYMESCVTNSQNLKKSAFLGFVFKKNRKPPASTDVGGFFITLFSNSYSTYNKGIVFTENPPLDRDFY